MTAAVLLTELIKASLAAASQRSPAWLLGLPLLGLAVSVLVLFGLGRGHAAQTIAARLEGATTGLRSWYSFPHDIARADLSGDVVNTAGAEERFPWALTAPRAAAMLSGGLSGWAINALFGLNLIRLVVPRVGPADPLAAVEATVAIGMAAGALTALTGEAIYWARGWRDRPLRRLLLGGALLLALALLRAGATTAAVLAGGCGGVFAAPFQIAPDLAGAAGAAAGIAGGYRLPLSAVATVLVAALSGLLTARAGNGLTTLARQWLGRR